MVSEQVKIDTKSKHKDIRKDEILRRYQDDRMRLQKELHDELKALHDEYGKDKCPNCGEPPTSANEENREAYCEPCDRNIFW